MIVDVIYALLADSKLLSFHELLALAKTCTSGWRHCRPRVKAWQHMFNTTWSPILTHTLYKLPSMARCSASPWYASEENQPPLYDSGFWADFPHLTPAQLALVYAMMIRCFPCFTQKIDHETKWTCFAHGTTGLPLRIPSESGNLASVSHPSALLVTITMDSLTGAVKHVVWSDGKTGRVGLNTLTCLLTATKQAGLIHYYGPALTFSDWFRALLTNASLPDAQ